jgi:hypothetical protein
MHSKIAILACRHIFHVIALVDSSIFCSGVQIAEESAFWAKLNRREASMARAVKREDPGHAGG